MAVSGARSQPGEPQLRGRRRQQGLTRCEGRCCTLSQPFRTLPGLASVIKGCMSSWQSSLVLSAPPWEGSRSWVPWAQMQSSRETEAAQSSPLPAPHPPGDQSLGHSGSPCALE